MIALDTNRTYRGWALVSFVGRLQKYTDSDLNCLYDNRRTGRAAKRNYPHLSLVHVEFKLSPVSVKPRRKAKP